MFNFTVEILMLVLCLVIIVVLFDVLTCRVVGPINIKFIRSVFLAALAIRILWAFIFLIFLSGNYPYAVSDDQGYYEFASRYAGSGTEGRNTYATFLAWLYGVFGNSSLTGRILNLFISALVVYPLSYIELNLNHKKMLAVKLYAFMPLMIFWSFFEIHDIIQLLLIMVVYAIITHYHKTQKILPCLLLIPIGFLLELFRFGMGAIVTLVFFLVYIQSKSNTTAKKIFQVLIIVFAVTASFIIFTQYIDSMFGYVDRYSRWIQTEVENTVFSFFMISSWKDIWKVPLSAFLYVLLPVSSMTSGRLYFDYGVYLRAFDAIINLFGLIFSIRYTIQEKWRSLLFWFPFIFLICFNLTNTRQGIIVFPIIYLMFAHGWQQSILANKYVLNTGGRRIKFKILILFSVILAWFFIILFVLN